MEALIIYTSLTGNTQACADIVAEALEKLGVDVDVQDVYDSEVEDFYDYDLCLVGCYSYGGHGELPDEIMDLWEDLAEVDLPDKVYACFGSADDFYPIFGAAVEDFEAHFEKSGATKGAEGVKVNLNPEEDDEVRLTKMAEDLVNTYKHLNS